MSTLRMAWGKSTPPTAARSSGNHGVKGLAAHKTEGVTGGRGSASRQVTGKRSALAAPALAVALLALTGCATGQSTALVSRSVSAADVQMIDELFVPYARPGAPGAAIVVIVNGQAAFVRGYGLAELETNTSVTERTNFRLASLTKAFTAMAILVLVNDGRLQLDDRVGDLLPEFPVYGRGIRIRHLLTHTSGLRAYQELVSDSPTRQIKDRDVLTVLRRTDSTYFSPGSAFRYGDSGYAILALVVERTSGEPFGRFLHNRIFTPTGMASTVAYEPGPSVVAHRALGYSLTPTGVRLSDQNTMSAVLGDGGIYSSVRDLIAWDRALDNHTLIDGQLQQLAWSPAALNDGTKTRYGFGWFIDRGATGFQLSHRGETSGFTNAILKYPDRRLTVVVLTNRRGGTPWSIAASVAALPSLQSAQWGAVP
jgi:CubicO group peptidase (beta-lactamase class C family)